MESLRSLIMNTKLYTFECFNPSYEMESLRSNLSVTVFLTKYSFNPSYEMESLRSNTPIIFTIISHNVSILLMKWNPYED